MGTTENAPRADPHERGREGVEHLRAAARELIEAARAMLDVAEEWVEDPEAVAALAGTLVSVGAVARRVAGTAGWPPAPAAPTAGAADEAGEADEDAAPRVQRIAVT